MNVGTEKRLKLVNQLSMDEMNRCSAANGHCGSYTNGYSETSELLHEINGQVKTENKLNVNMQRCHGTNETTNNGQEISSDGHRSDMKDKKTVKVQPWMIPGQTDLTFIRQLADLAIKEGLMKGMDRKE